MRKEKILAAVCVTVLSALSVIRPSFKNESVALPENLNEEAVASLSMDPKSNIVYQQETTITDSAEGLPSIFQESTVTVEGGYDWVINKVSDPQPGYIVETYRLIYDDRGNLISKTLLSDETIIQEAVPAIYSNGQKLEPGAYYVSSRSTAYGVDCELCSGRDTGIGSTASGVRVSTTAVLQDDGEWLDGITYEGYYIIATSQSIPLCTVVEIKDHSYSGYGLTPGEPFEAIVLDRGVGGTAIDLFAGSEYGGELTNGKNRTPTITILKMGKLYTNSLGQRACQIEE